MGWCAVSVHRCDRCKALGTRMPGMHYTQSNNIVLSVESRGIGTNLRSYLLI